MARTATEVRRGKYVGLVELDARKSLGASRSLVTGALSSISRVSIFAPTGAGLIEDLVLLLFGGGPLIHGPDAAGVVKALRDHRAGSQSGSELR